MGLAETVRMNKAQLLMLNGQQVEWHTVRSAAAKKLRIKVGPDGVRVVLPTGRTEREAAEFLANNGAWVAEQWERTRSLSAVRRPRQHFRGRILFRGNSMAIKVVHTDHWRAPNKVVQEDGAITITVGPNSRTAIGRSIENWLRKQARDRLEQYIAENTKHLKRTPHRIYVMGQRTKWGNCSPSANLSFNWRLIMAPDMVLRYIVTHEMVHLVVPDHSPKFWLTVQSLCPVADRARQWLVAHGQELLCPLPDL